RPLARYRGRARCWVPYNLDRRRLFGNIQHKARRNVWYSHRGRRMDSETTGQSARTIMKTVDQLKVKIFADGADKTGMLEMYKNPHVRGFTTNPSLMRKAGV